MKAVMNRKAGCDISKPTIRKGGSLMEKMARTVAKGLYWCSGGTGPSALGLGGPLPLIFSLIFST
jgi:hypothetical protein